MKDLSPGQVPAAGLNPNHVSALASGVLFVGPDNELWHSDGTPNGTHQVREIRPGPQGSSCFWYWEDRFVALGDVALFPANDGSSGCELWRSDGTEEGTWMVREIRPGPYGGGGEIYHGVVMDGVVYFAADDGTHGGELWRTDGTPEGTWLVADSVPGPEGAGVFDLAQLDGVLFFSAETPDAGRELWRSDGTSAGTRLFVDINPTAAGASSDPSEMVAAGHQLFFSADDGVHGRGLWVSDGSEAGTRMVACLGTWPRTLTSVRGGVFFLLTGDVAPYPGVWFSDGTEAGTRPVAELSTNIPTPYPMVEFLDEEFFVVRYNTGWELRRADPDAGGSVLVRSFSSDICPTELTPAGGLLFMRAAEGEDSELWVSDGTGPGTVPVKDIEPGPTGSSPHSFAAVGGRVFFGASEDTHGRELWMSDGSEVGTSMLSDYVEPASTWIQNLTPLDDRLYFTRDDELWRSDGDEGSTVLIARFSAPASELTAVGDRLYFVASEIARNQGLWRTDGTSAGTSLVADLWASQLTAAGDLLVFRGTPLCYPGLWRTDGTAEGTYQISPLDPDDLTPVGDLALFFADDGIHGRDLWRTDGSAAGTHLVTEVVAGDWNVHINRTASDGRHMFFTLRPEYSLGEGLYRTDGTAEGTVELDSFDYGSSPDRLTPAASTLYYLEFTRVGTSPLWTVLRRSSGYPPGPQTVWDFGQGSSTYPQYLESTGDMLFFAAPEPGVADGPRRLWVSDGTSGGTGFLPVPEWTYDQQEAALDGRVYSFGGDDATGGELYVTDGTEEGTTLVADIAPGSRWSEPLQLTATRSRLFFTADDGEHGRELWVVDLGLEQLFSDSFESGDTSSWAATVP